MADPLKPLVMQRICRRLGHLGIEKDVDDKQILSETNGHSAIKNKRQLADGDLPDGTRVERARLHPVDGLAIVSFLVHNHRIQHLQLAGNNLRDIAAKAILDWACDSDSINFLDLSHNHIGERTNASIEMGPPVRALLLCLGGAPKITSIGIAGNVAFPPWEKAVTEARERRRNELNLPNCTVSLNMGS